MLRLRYIDGPMRPCTVTFAHTLDGALAYLKRYDHEILCCEEDADNSQHWDIATVMGNDVHIFTVTPIDSKWR